MRLFDKLFGICDHVQRRDPAKTSWAEAWREATRGFSLEELHDIKELVYMVNLSARDRLREELCRMGLPVSGSALLDVNLRVNDDWFLAPFLGKPSIHYGSGTEMSEWHGETIELPEPLLLESGPYTVLKYSNESVVVLITARRIAPLPWAAQYAAAKESVA